ncbi:MAG: hypothetical protein VB958_08005 [Thalassolituus sp.]|uniref:hypothetical protein n=1 Tax=Thalassolituus sp. TaxID=2030822 RepID=UPI0039821D0E
MGDLLSDFAKATRKLKLQGKKRKAKGNSAKFSDMEADQVQAKKTDAHGAETGEVSKPAPKPATNQKNQTLTAHDTAVANHKKDYEIKRDQAIANGESKRTIGAYKARVTEAKGEAAASDYMTKNHPDAEMVQGFSKGSGFDQVWVKRAPDGSIEEYIIVEAKGPGAKLAIKGGKGPQMSQQWVDNTNIEMTTSKNPEISQLGKDLTDAIDYGPPPKVSGLGLEAVEKNGVVTGAKEITLPNGTAFN